MANIYPFCAVRPPADKAAAVSSPPYDVMSRSEATEMAADNPVSFLHVTRSEIDLPETCNPYSETVYQKARENYKALKQDVPLTRDTTPAYYVYALEINGHRQIGIAATAAVEDYRKNVILKHEKTRRQKEDDRTNHILTTGAQTGPVFLTYKDRQPIDEIVDRTVNQAHAVADFKGEDGVRNTVWKIAEEDNAKLQRQLAELPNLYIADGHHRAASAARACESIAGEGNNSSNGSASDDPAGRFLAVIFPASQLRILAYNRVIEDLNGMTAEQFLKKLENTPFKLEKSTKKEPPSPRSICMYLAREWHLLTFTGNLEGMPASDALDVAILQREILDPILSISDPRVDERIDFVGGIRGVRELEKRVDSGESSKLAFSMYPTTVEQLMAVSDAGQIMPPKSTWFEPKLRDGLLIHEIS
ncbi:MAG: DUF1015 family protein [Lentisphaeria bacterium]